MDHGRVLRLHQARQQGAVVRDGSSATRRTRTSLGSPPPSREPHAQRRERHDGRGRRSCGGSSRRTPARHGHHDLRRLVSRCRGSRARPRSARRPPVSRGRCGATTCGRHWSSSQRSPSRRYPVPGPVRSFGSLTAEPHAVGADDRRRLGSRRTPAGVHPEHGFGDVWEAAAIERERDVEDPDARAPQRPPPRRRFGHSASRAS